MTWILDVVAIFFVLGFSLYGLFKGTYYMIIDTLLVVVCVAAAGFGAYLTVTYPLAELGLLDGFAEVWTSILGNSKVSGGQEVIETVAYYISYGLLILVAFIIYDVLLHFVRKLLLKCFNGLRSKVGFIKGLDNFLAFIVNAAVSVGIVLVFTSFCYAFKDNDYILRQTNEALQASEVLSLIYEINPLNSILCPVFENVETFLSQFIHA